MLDHLNRAKSVTQHSLKRQAEGSLRGRGESGTQQSKGQSDVSMCQSGERHLLGVGEG